MIFDCLFGVLGSGSRTEESSSPSESGDAWGVRAAEPYTETVMYTYAFTPFGYMGRNMFVVVLKEVSTRKRGNIYFDEPQGCKTFAGVYLSVRFILLNRSQYNYPEQVVGLNHSVQLVASRGSKLVPEEQLAPRSQPYDKGFLICQC